MKLLAALIIFSIPIAFVMGCHSLKEPLAPSQLSAYRLEKEVRANEADYFAASFAQEKQLKKTTKPKISDPAWASIRKKKIDSSKELTLIELVDMALRNNPKTQQAWQNTRIARAVKGEAQSKFFPQATISETLAREKVSATLPAADLDDRHYGPAGELTWLLLDFGGRSSGVEGAFQKMLSADFQYNQSLQDLLLEVERAYYDFYSSQAELVAVQDNVANAEADYNAAVQRNKYGLVPQLDVLQAKTNYEGALYSLENAKGRVKTSKANLAKLIGVSADSDFSIASPAKDLPTNVTEQEVTSFIEEAIQIRPDISALRAELAASKAAVKSATSDLLPALNLNGSAGKNNYKYYSAQMAKEHDYDYSGSLSVDWNIFDGFYSINKRKAAKGEAEIAYQKLIEAELAASADVWIKYYNYNTAVGKFTFSQAALETAQSSYDLATQSYNAGIKSILDLLQAQSKLSESRSRLILSKKDVFVTLAELAHATGSIIVKGDESK